MKLWFAEGEYPKEKKAQKTPCPPEQFAEVHTGSAQNGIDTVSLLSLESVPIHAVFKLKMPDPRFNGSPPLHPAP